MATINGNNNNIIKLCFLGVRSVLQDAYNSNPLNNMGPCIIVIGGTKTQEITD